MRTAVRALLWMMAPLAAASLAQDAPAPADRNAPYALPFGLDCKKCLGYEASTGCLAVAKIPILAVVQGPREVNASRDCATVKDPHYGQVRHCSVFAAVRFSQIEFLRNDVKAAAQDSYLSSYQSTDLVPDSKEGVFLRPDRRYLILAGRANPQAVPKADWYLARACELTNELVQ